MASSVPKLFSKVFKYVALKLGIMPFTGILGTLQGIQDI